MAVSASQHIAIFATYKDQGTSFKECPGCAGCTGRTETQMVLRDSQECYDVFHPVALPPTVGAPSKTVLLSQCSVKRRPISKIVTSVAKPHVVPPIPIVAGALTPKTLQPTLKSGRRCCVCFLCVSASSASTVLMARGRVHPLCSRCSGTTRNPGWCCSI